MYLVETEQIALEHPDLEEAVSFIDYYIRKSREYGWTCFLLSRLTAQSSIPPYDLLRCIEYLVDLDILIPELIEAQARSEKYEAVVIYRITDKAKPKNKIQ